MTLEERVSRLEQHALELGRIEQRLERVEAGIAGLRQDFQGYRAENAAILERILATLSARQGFRWPWEARS